MNPPPREGEGDSIKKIPKTLIQNCGPNPHQKFSWIRKYLKIGGTEIWGKRKKKNILDQILAIFKVP